MAVGAEDAPVATIGRQSELEIIARFLDAVAAGPSALVIEGEAGIGKTTLCNEALAAAQHGRFRVMFCRPAQSESGLPYLGLGDLLAHVPDEVLAELPGPQRRALEVALLQADTEGQPLQQRALSTAVSTVLPILARPGPVLVVIDDVQWLDPPTRRVLRYAIRRLPPAPIGLLLALRSGPAAGDDPLALESALPPGSLVRMIVGPLEPPSLARLLHTRLSAPFTQPTLRRVAQTSGGNPFFALELARVLLDQDVTSLPGEPLRAPPNLTDLLGARLRRLPHVVRQALTVAAALSRPTVDLLRVAVGTTGTTEVLERAADAGLIEIRGGSVRFTHPLLASVLYSQASPGQRRRLHRRLAGVVTDPEERARHLALGTVEPDQDVATAIEDAAMCAARRGAPDASAALLEQAIRLTPPAAVDCVLRRTLDAADQHLAAGDTPRARVLFDQVASVAGAGPVRARALQGSARVRVLEGRFRDAKAQLVQALDEAGDDHALRIAVGRDLVFTLVQVGDIPEAVRHARAAVEAAEASAAPAVLAESLYYLGMALSMHGLQIDDGLLERAATLDQRVGSAPRPEHPGLGTGRFPLALILKWTDRFADARALLRTLYAEHIEHGDDAGLSPVLFALGELECWTGNWNEAERVAGELHAIAARTGQAVVDARAVTVEAMVAVRCGDAASAEAKATASLAFSEASDDMPALLRSLRSKGLLALSLGHPENAVLPLQRGVELERAAGFSPGVSRLLPDAVESLVAVGRLGDARPLVESLEEHARRHRLPWAVATAARARGIFDAASGDVGAALVALQRAMGAHQGLGEPFELARTLLAMGRIERRSRQRRSARRSLDQALAIFESLGATRWAELARQELGRIGGRASTPFELTVTERRVAELVAQGQTNREVAGALFMSVKTAEANLTRIYGKLGVSSRRELARSLRSEPGGTVGSNPRGFP